MTKGKTIRARQPHKYQKLGRSPKHMSLPGARMGPRKIGTTGKA